VADVRRDHRSPSRPARKLRLGLLGGFATLLALLALGSSASAATHPLAIGFGDRMFRSSNPSEQNLWLDRAVETGSSWVRINVIWAKTAPEKLPAGFEAANASAPGYRWEETDSAVRAASAHGLKVLLTISVAPRWAEGPNRPADAKSGSWEPEPAALGAFGHALAERYDGAFADPKNPGSTLPRVSFFDSWNEPNLANYLAPQINSAGQLVGPTIYRKMLNQFYAGVKQAQPAASVIGPSSASFGAPNGFSTAPVLFLRELLCLKGSALKPVSCPEKAHLDDLAAHTIQVGPPTESAESPLDATVPDLGRLTAVVQAAEKAGTLETGGHPLGLWVTEFWVDSNPPDPGGIPLYKQARWYEQNLYEFWKAGAKVAIELQIRDESPGTLGYPLTLQSGVYFLDGKPKPSQVAMRFPFVAHRAAGGKVAVWGIAPKAGQVRIEAFSGGAWKTVGRVHAGGRGRPFTAEVSITGGGNLRAGIGNENSLTWKLG
jgi:hypothetical protein